MSSSETPAPDPSPDRDELLSILAANVRALDAVIDSEPADSPDEERIRLQQLRTLASLVAEYRKLKKDCDLDEMAEEIDLLTTDGESP